MISKRTKKYLTLLLSLAIVLTLAPVTVSAEGQSQPWAEDAVDALNTLYGSSTFTADDTSVTVGAAKNLLLDIFSYPSNGEIITNYLANGDDDQNLTRLQLAQVVFSLYGLTSDLPAVPFDDCDHIAAVTLRSLGIVSGKGNNIFAPEDTVTNAELAVIFYRALGKVGAGGITEFEGLRPGEYGYDEFSYLFTRSCATRDINPFENIETVSVRHYVGDDEYVYTGKEEIWNFWTTRLAGLPSDGRTVTWSVYEEVYGPDPEAPVSFLDAAIKVVAEDRAALISDGMADKTGIFSDVNPGNWYYDGVMYLFNKGIVNGGGSGTFMPDNQLTRAELAALMCRINQIDTSSPAPGVELSDEGIPGWAYNSITHAIDRGYMIYTDGTYFTPGGQITRQEAALAIFESYGGYDAGNVSLSVLDRFSDSSDVGEAYKTAMAYLVSSGVVRGGADGRVMPNDVINRATFSILVSRVMMGLDKSKMHDYETALTEVLQ